MKIPEFLKNNVDQHLRREFNISLVADNNRRGKILAVIVIAFEAVYCIIDILALMLNVDRRFNYSGYLAMYLLMIVLNTFYLGFIRHYEKQNDPTDKRLNRQNIVLIIYITFVLSWGSVVTLMDQGLYGQIVAFSVNMITCSVVYLLDNRKILIPYSISVLILALGLPFFQKSGDILIGHYVNLVVFVIISWLASRLLFNSYRRNFLGRVMLRESNTRLEHEIDENRKINARLAQANDQLKKLTLLDELTGIPNRRSFRDFIDRAFELLVKESSTVSIVMIDIDYFKQFNDSYGHEAGDRALIEIASRINSVVEEPFEFAVRWGGEEFIYAAFNISQDVVAGKAAAILDRITALDIRHENSPVSSRITVSLGAATIRVNKKNDISRALKRADEALYLAKSVGRNCVKVLNDTGV